MVIWRLAPQVGPLHSSPDQISMDQISFLLSSGAAARLKLLRDM